MYLRYNDLVIQAAGGDPPDLVWLAEFLSPPFDAVGSGVEPGCAVVLARDGRGYEDALERGPQGGATIDCFALDSRMIRLPLWQSSGQDQVIFHEESEVFYSVNVASAVVRILARNRGGGARKAQMRVVREFAMNHSIRRGGLVVHGAGFVVGKGGIIIAGPKGAGKTTLLIHVLQRTRARFASNDRLVVTFDESGPVMQGMPTIVALRQATLEMFPDLHRRLLANGPHYSSSLGEEASGQAPVAQPDRNGRFSISPAQFCELLQVKPVAGAKVRAVLFPEIRSAAGTITIKELSAEVATTRLVNALFRAGCPQRSSSAFFPRGDNRKPDRGSLHAQCVRLASEVPCLECELGPKAYTDDASTAQLVALFSEWA